MKPNIKSKVNLNKNTKSLFSRINWTNSLFLTILPVIAIAGTIYLGFAGAIYWQTLVLAFVLLVFGGLSITAGYHRLFSHLTYKASRGVRLFFLAFGAAMFENSVLEWCNDHRNHHRYTDTDKDPYNAKRGFWYSHIGWIMIADSNARNFDNIEDLEADPAIQFQDKFYLPVSLFIGFALPIVIASLWGDALGGFIIAGALRIVLCQQGTFCINSICHIFGKQTYSDRCTAKDNWATALVTFGEGYHNFHHQFPLDYRNGIRAYDFDPTKWLIKSLSYFGLASDLKEMTSTKILEYRIRMDEKNMLTQENKSASWLDSLGKKIKPVRESIMQNIEQIEVLEKRMIVAKNEYVKAMKDRVHYVELKQKLKQAKLELKLKLQDWSELMSSSCQMV